MKCNLRWVVNYIRFPVEQVFSLSLREEEFVYILSREGGLYLIIIFSCLRFVWVTVWPPLFVDKAIKWLNKQKLLYRADFLLFSFLIRLNTPFSYSADHSVSFTLVCLYLFSFDDSLTIMLYYYYTRSCGTSGGKDAFSPTKGTVRPLTVFGSARTGSG